MAAIWRARRCLTQDAPVLQAAGGRAYAVALIGSFGRNDQIVDVTGRGHRGFVRLTGTRSDMNNYQHGAQREVRSAYMRWSAGRVVGG